MRRLLTDRLLRSLAALADAGETRDTAIPGFAVRRAGAGRLSFSLSYRPPRRRGRGGQKRRLALGHWPETSLVQARERALAARREIDRGVDPADPSEATGITLRDLWARFDRVGGRRGSARHVAERVRVFEREILPAFGDRRVAELRRGELLELLDSIVERGSPVQANRTRAHLHALLAWAVERDLLAANPLAGTRRPTRERSRERVLSAEELREAWSAVAELEPAVCLTFRFRIATLQRGGEVAAIGPRHVAGAWWTIPRELTKMKHAAHRVPLGAIALEVLAAAREARIATADLFFPSSATGRPLEVSTPARAIRRLAAAFGWAPWTPHDLRRTGSTYLAAAGVAESTIGRLLSHSPGEASGAPRVTATYNRHAYDVEKLEAILTWERLLAVILDGGELAAALEGERQRRAQALDLGHRPGHSAGG